MRKLGRILVASCVPLLASNASAQTRVEAKGQGSLSHAGQAETLSSASLELGLTGELSLQLQGSAAAFSFRGRWSGSGTDAVRLSVSDALGDARANGAGTATIRAGELIHLDLSGTSRSGRFVAVFDALAPAETPLVENPSGFSLDQNATGSGSLKPSRAKAEDLKKLHVILEKNGAGQVTLWGARSSTLVGRWKNVGRDHYELEVTTGFGSDKTRASLRIYLQRGRVNIVEGAGSSPGTGGDFTLRFDAGR